MGKQSKTIYVTSNDPVKKKVSLIIKGELYKVLRVSPKTLTFGEVPSGESKTMTFKVIPWADTEFKIEKIEMPTDDFEARVVRPPGRAPVWKLALRSARDGLVRKFGSKSANDTGPESSPNTGFQGSGGDTLRAAVVAVTVRKTAQIGRRSGGIRIHTDLEEKPVLELFAYVDVVGHISVEPPAHNFGVIRAGQKKVATFVITSKERKMFKINRVENKCKQVSVHLTEVEPGARYELRVETLLDAPAGNIRGTAKLHTSDPNQPEIEIRLYGNIQN